TAAHSTVRIDGQDQSEVWASHRVGRRARRVWAGTEEGTVAAAHDGYGRLPGRPVHERRVSVTESGLIIVDSFEGAGDHDIESFLHLHPDCAASVDDRDILVTRDGRGVARVSPPEGVDIRVVEGTWHRSFHTSVPNRRIEIQTQRALPTSLETAISWLD
ncbi:MAG: heparinase, partial [Candidatus Eisenbacteria bacterium]|nr:heparinase [Candidatus Eisenbacteria bacterium]